MLRACLITVGLLALLPDSALAAGNVIPAAFRGIWAPNSTDCRDVDGVNHLTIERRTFYFYEGRSDSNDFQVEIVSPGRIRIRSVIEYGDGPEAVNMDFELSPDRKALFWSGYGRDPQPKDPYVRCPR